MSHAQTEVAGLSPAAAATRSGRRWSRQVASDSVVLVDVIAILAGLAATTWIHDTTPLGPGGTLVALLEIGLAAAMLGSGLLRESNLYATTDMTRFPVGPWRALGMLTMLFICIAFVGLSFNVLSLTPVSWFPLWLAVTWPLVVGGRLASRAFYRMKAKQGLFSTNVAVFGSGSVAMRLHDHLASNASDISLVGVYDDRQLPRANENSQSRRRGGLEDLIADGRAGLVDQIIIALPASADQRITQVARKLEQLPVSVHVCTHIATDLVDVGTRAHKVSNLGPIGMIDVKRKPLADWGVILKGIEDRVLGALFLLVGLPVFAMIALAIKLDDGGPVLFRQKRRGLNHRPIEVLKFRSMRIAPVTPALTPSLTPSLTDEVKQATKDDPRVTRVGRFLRRSSLDELPQLVNVLRGEMSLVGPRPHAIVHDEYWGEHLEQYANRQQVKPGMTGWAQVNGFRGETETSEKMRLRVEHDLHYINNWSLLLDLRIIATTPIFGFTNQNAY
jgi:Undecaprenyl-phosphate glucose phosphotransferase